MRHRLNIIVAGAPRSGKTFYAQKLADKYSKKGKGILAYNVGLHSDFDEYEEIEFMDKYDTSKFLDKKQKRIYFERPEIRLFKYRGKIYDMKYFYQISKGKKLKAYRIADAQSEDLLFISLYKYAKDMLIIFDDIRPVFRAGLKKGSINLFSRINHTGLLSKDTAAKNGVDIILIFHNLDKVNSELYDYATHLVTFYCTRRGEVDNSSLNDVIEEAYNDLKTCEKYTRYEINIQDATASKFSPNN